MAMSWLTAEEKIILKADPWLIDSEKEEWSIIDVNNVVCRTAAACCVSESPVKFCRLDAKPPKETKLETKVKAWLGRPRITADEILQAVLFA